MFATLLGPLPRPAGDGLDAVASDDEVVVAAIRAQEDAGLEPITDGRLRRASSGLPGGGVPASSLDAAEVVAAWRFAASQTHRAVKQTLPGPYTLGRGAVGALGADAVAADAVSPDAVVPERAAATFEAAQAVREAVEALAAAGCPMVEVEETESHLIGADEGERALFRDAHRRLTEGTQGTHLSLSIVGGSAWAAGIETILDAPYASLAVDLIDGPDNWNLVTRWPGDRGVIVGALPAKASPADAKEVLLWAARYAVTSNGRGLDRVGIGSAGSWANLTWAAAVEKMGRLGEAARLASTLSASELARNIDPRALSRPLR